MKILVLGADGMLGHSLVENWKQRHEVIGTVRAEPDAYRGIVQFFPEAVHYGIDVRDYAKVEALLQSVRPDAVVNGVGIVKQRDEAKHATTSIEINALLPHRLAGTCAEIGARFVHLSTDCVFSGRRGRYTETDIPDAGDLYGRSKLLGEVEGVNAITLRTSIIGLELSRKRSLVEWFLAQGRQVTGFRKAIFSGFTTSEMARIIEHVIVRHPRANGVYHVSSAPIDKYTLLCRIRDRLRRDVVILPDDSFVCDRSLDSTRFQADFSYTPPPWESMIEQLGTQIEERYGR